MKIIKMVFLTVWTCFALNFAKAQTSDSIVTFGKLSLHISDSWTAQVFHITDQLSNWSPYTHRQYIRWAKKRLKLTSEDSSMLRQYADLRKLHTNSSDFDRSFLIDGSIEDATTAATGFSGSEANLAKSILTYFSKRLSMLKDTAVMQEKFFFGQLSSQQAQLNASIQKMLLFTETTNFVDVPVFLVANPEDGSGGGEANSNILVIEMQRHPSPMPVLIHESLHFLLRPYLPQIKAAAESAHVDWEVINEGFAYAMQDLVDDPDHLSGALVRNLAAGKLLSDRYSQFYMAGLIFRPMLREALEKGGTFRQLLPKAIEEWRKLSIPQ